jgi:LPS sulfotransferase NodH
VTPSSYLLCGTPRTGSTFLCSLLSSTGVAGHPESYFREPDEPWWAERLGVPGADFPRFVAAVSAAGRTGNGVFTARVMWGSIEHVVGRLPAAASDLAALERALGPLRLVHLRRADAVAQAVSWTRAEQTGYWQQDDERRAPPRLDLDRIDATVRTIRAHDQAWSDWFDRQGAVPLRVAYEQLVRDPGATVRRIWRTSAWTHRPAGNPVPRTRNRRTGSMPPGPGRTGNAPATGRRECPRRPAAALTRCRRNDHAKRRPAELLLDLL